MPYISRPSPRVAPQLERGAATHIVALRCQPGLQMGNRGCQKGAKCWAAGGRKAVGVEEHNGVAPHLQQCKAAGSRWEALLMLQMGDKWSGWYTVR